MLLLFKRLNWNGLRCFVFFEREKKKRLLARPRKRLCRLPIPGTHGWRSSICGANATTTHAYDFPGTKNKKNKKSRGNRRKLCSNVVHVKLPSLMQGTHAGGRYFAFVTRLPKVKGWSGHVPVIGSGIDDGNDVAGGVKLELSIAGGGKCS